MTLTESIASVLATARQQADAVSSSADLDQFRLTFLSRKGSVARLFEQLKDLPASDKPALGKQLNELRMAVEKLYAAAEERYAPATIQSQSIDRTLPGRERFLGTEHLITSTVNEFKSIFVGMGFSIVEGPEIESDYYNFEALNFSPDHPARDMQDTFFLSDGVMLRTHTTPVQIRIMEKTKPPIRAIMPGKVYRNEAVSARSHVHFHQVDGIYVDKGVTFAELKGTLVSFARQYYGSSIKYRFRASYFPFTEPSAEMDITCFLCSGKGCRVCKKSGWLEIVGSGMVHPNILRRVGYDPDEVSGYAFGFGVERTVMLRHGIDDIRLLYENDVRFLGQF